jgi:hypothetical protein
VEKWRSEEVPKTVKKRAVKKMKRKRMLDLEMESDSPLLRGAEVEKGCVSTAFEASGCVPLLRECAHKFEVDAECVNTPLISPLNASKSVPSLEGRRSLSPSCALFAVPRLRDLHPSIKKAQNAVRSSVPGHPPNPLRRGRLSLTLSLPLSLILLLAVMLFATNRVTAQNLPVGDIREDHFELMQLLSGTESAAMSSFANRGVWLESYREMVLSSEPTYDMGVWNEPFLNREIRMLNRWDQEVWVGAYDVSIGTTYNSELPWGENNGAAWYGAGTQPGASGRVLCDE